MRHHVPGAHAEGIGLHLKAVLSALQCTRDDSVNLTHLGVGHGVAAGRGAGAVHHQRLAGVTERRFQPVGITEIEGNVIL
ncbi:hypothetical protein D3C72_722990 [compost metagenome]